MGNCHKRLELTNVIAFPGLVEKKFTLSELVATADKVAPARVEEAIFEQVKLLTSLGAETLPAIRLRQWVIVGTLINRLLFELHQIPKDPGFLL